MEKNRIGVDWIDWNKSFRPKTWINRMKGVEKKKEEEEKKRTLFPLPFLLALERRYAHYYWWTSIHRAKREMNQQEKKKRRKRGENESGENGKIKLFHRRGGRLENVEARDTIF